MSERENLKGLRKCTPEIKYFNLVRKRKHAFDKNGLTLTPDDHRLPISEPHSYLMPEPYCKLK